MDLGIDFEDELFFAVRPLLYRIISECKNHSHHNFDYIETSFEIFIVPNDGGRWITLMEGYVENGQSLNEVDPDFVTVDRYGTLLDKLLAFGYTYAIRTKAYYRNISTIHRYHRAFLSYKKTA